MSGARCSHRTAPGRSVRGGATLLVAMLVAATGCTAPDAQPPGADRGGSRAEAGYEVVECPGVVAAVVVGEVECGQLVVPADRTSPETGTVRAFVGRIRPPEVLHDDPVLVLGGGSYGGIAPLAPRVGREVVILDYRGSNRSDPSLECPEVERVAGRVVSLPTADPGARELLLGAVDSCHERLTRSGVDPGDFGLAAMAADAEDLRTALGIDQWNVITYGASSRVALELLRQHPEHLRSLILDSPEVPGVDPRGIAPSATRDALAAVAAACQDDERCDDRFPDVAGRLEDTLEDLADTPVPMTMAGPASRGRPVDVPVDDALALRVLRGMLSDGGSSGLLMLPGSVPALLELLGGRQAGRLGPTLSPAAAGPDPLCLGYVAKCLPFHLVGHGVGYSVLCHDVAPFADAAPTDRRPGYGPAFGRSPWRDLCEAWPVGEGPASVAAPVTGDVPVLAAVGRFDPYTPEATVREELAGLTRLSVVVDPAHGFNVLPATECLLRTRGAWLDDLEDLPDPLPCLANQRVDWTLRPQSLVVSDRRTR